MKILFSNDDGYGAPGIEALTRAFSSFDYEVVAPDRERSGTSQTLTLVHPVRVMKKGERRFACSGFPADCVMYSLLGVLENRPDWVISGINAGPNLGTDLIYSGTAAAARQAALWGVPAMAVSLCGAHKAEEKEYDTAARWLRNRFDEIAALYQPDTFININIPCGISDDAPYFKAAPARRFYSDKIEKFIAADKSEYYFLMGGAPKPPVDPDSDSYLVAQGKIALSLIKIHPEAAD